MASSAAVRAEDADVARFLTGLAPDDPQTHYSAAVLLEKSFEPADVEAALKEYEIAAGLAPENFLYWFDLGRARERSGDSTGAERALRRALELAPNYARVQWALGNTLLRQGRVDEGFAEIRKAVASDPAAFAGPTANTAWQFFDQDLAAIRHVAGGSVHIEAALVSLMIREKRIDEAVEIWNGIPTSDRQLSLRETGKALLAALLAAKRFRAAGVVMTGLGETGEAQPEQITNGGFETAVKPAGAGPFEWMIAPGLQPQIVLSSGQKHGGNNSLLVIYSSNDGKDFRGISQLIAVQPGTSYEIEIFYRSDLKTNAVFKWQVTDAADETKPLAVSEAISNRPEWSSLLLKFQSSPSSDGVVLRLIRENCGPVCPVTGTVMFDDISLRRAVAR